MQGIASHAGRRPKALGSRRSGRAGEPPEGVGKPCRCPASPAAPLLPGGSPARSLWVITKDLWYYTIGGYQVLKKWLSYREYALLGRPLAAEEARTLSEVARRLAALRLLEPALDANYNAVRADTYPWPQTERDRA